MFMLSWVRCFLSMAEQEEGAEHHLLNLRPYQRHAGLWGQDHRSVLNFVLIKQIHCTVYKAMLQRCGKPGQQRLACFQGLRAFGCAVLYPGSARLCHKRQCDSMPVQHSGCSTLMNSRFCTW